MPPRNLELRQKVADLIAAGLTNAEIQKETGSTNAPQIRKMLDRGLGVDAILNRKGDMVANPYPKPPQGMKRCSTCRTVKPADASEFYRTKGNRDGFEAMCIPCHKAYQSAFRQKKKPKTAPKTAPAQATSPVVKYDTLALDKTAKFGSAYSQKREEVDVPMRAEQSLITRWLQCPVASKPEFILRIESLLNSWKDAQ